MNGILFFFFFIPDFYYLRIWKSPTVLLFSLNGGHKINDSPQCIFLLFGMLWMKFLSLHTFVLITRRFLLTSHFIRSHSNIQTFHVLRGKKMYVQIIVSEMTQFFFHSVTFISCGVSVCKEIKIYCIHWVTRLSYSLCSA
jgi:hypothetical protein